MSNVRSILNTAADGVVARVRLHTAEKMLRHALVRSALEMTAGNVSRAAMILGTHRNSVHNILREMATTGEQERQ